MVTPFYCDPIALATTLPKCPRVQLQWIDSSTNVVPLEWPSAIRWIWKDKFLRAQIWIELPPLLRVKLPSESQLKLLEDGNRSVLVGFIQNSTLTQKLGVGEHSNGEEGNAGLVMSLDFDSTHYFIHQSCLREGISIQEITPGSPFLFLGMYCTKHNSHDVTVQFSISEDATLSKTNYDTTSSPVQLKLDLRQHPKIKFAIKTKTGLTFAEYKLVFRKASQLNNIRNKDKRPDSNSQSLLACQLNPINKASNK